MASSAIRILILSGARSDKPSWVEHELLTTVTVSTGGALDATASTVLHYITTARSQPDDSDFHSRVGGHRIRRQAQAQKHGVAWHTVDNADTVDALASPKRRTLLDDVGAWLMYVVDT